MNRVLLVLVAVLAVVAQTTLVPVLNVAGVAPDLVFLLVIFIALRRQTTLGLWMAFGLGLLQDVAGGGLLGQNALVLLGVAYLAMYLRRKFFQENLVSQVLVLLLFTLLQQFLSFFWLNTLLETGFPFSLWPRRALTMGIMHAVLGPFLFWGLRGLIKDEDGARNIVSSPGPPSHLSRLGRHGS